MGGRGSGSYYRYNRSSNLTTDYLDLDLRVFKKKGWLKPNTTNSITWSRNGNKIGNISYRLTDDTMTLLYNVRTRGEEEWQPIEEDIRVIKTPCHFGGERTWFSCPSCQRRVLILYGDTYFRCRTCLGAVHPSVNETKMDRSRRALARYQVKLAPDIKLCANDGVRHIHKPKWMRYKTYFDLKMKGARKEDEMNQYFVESLGHLF